MNLLVDTHISLWAADGDPRLPERARELISAPENAIFVSIVSLWEIAIKRNLWRRRLGQPGPQAIRISAKQAWEFYLEAGYRVLDLSPSHTATYEELPHLHGDPFDRMLIAQALTEQMHLITRDRTLAAYSNTVILV